MADPRTNAGAKFYIAVDDSGDALPTPSNLSQSEFEALDWLEVVNVGSVGETGTTTNIPTYDTLATDVTLKSKGISNAGDPEIEVALTAGDPGQVQMRAAASTRASYAFKYQHDDAVTPEGEGMAFYNRGIVTGPRHPNGRNEDFVLEMYQLGLNQKEIVVEPT